MDATTGATVGILETGLRGAQPLSEYALLWNTMGRWLVQQFIRISIMPGIVGGIPIVVYSVTLYVVLYQVAGMLGLFPYWHGFFAQ